MFSCLPGIFFVSYLQFSEKLLEFTIIFAALTQGCFSTLSSVLLMKPSVYCQAKRQNKLEKKHLSIFLPEEQKKKKKKVRTGIFFNISKLLKARTREKINTVSMHSIGPLMTIVSYSIVTYCCFFQVLAVERLAKL